MARGDKSKYTAKQKRMAEHIEEGYEDRGVGHEEAEKRAWATVNKATGGAGKRITNKSPMKKGGKLGGKKGGKKAGKKTTKKRAKRVGKKATKKTARKTGGGRKKKKKSA